MNFDALKTIWAREERISFQGWDFLYLESRWQEEGLPWDYREIIQGYLKSTDRLLDMGTGGGEFLLSLGHPYAYTAVTEAWAPNLKVCKEKLEPLGIHVYPVEDDSRLPIHTDMFDIVINRHEAYDLHEVSRVLHPNGFLITQQVGCNNNRDLSEYLIPDFVSQYSDFSLPAEKRKFEANGFEILFCDESFPEIRFFDVGAIVFYARRIPWEFPNFSVENNFRQLCSLHQELTSNGFIGTRGHRFIIVARNGKTPE